MADRGLLFSGIMVNALLQDLKTNTRRLDETLSLAKIRKGDHLWVRETWFCDDYRASPLKGPDGKRHYPKPANVAELVEWRQELYFRADGEPRWEDGGKTRWWPSLHMMRWASRVLLEATEDARRERLQAISEEDALAEGTCIRHAEVPEHGKDGNPPSPRDCFRAAFDSINGPGTWTRNPEITRLAFRVKSKEFTPWPPPAPTNN